MSIQAAIEERRLLTFMYDGHPRTVEPHTYGIDKKGHLALRAYQVGGGSRAGERVGWKFFHVHEMRGVAVSPQTFQRGRADYRRNDPAFMRISAQL